MDDTFYENVEDKPSHTIYEGDNMIYIRNNIFIFEKKSKRKDSKI